MKQYHFKHKSKRTNSAVWPLPYACAQPYHPGSLALIGTHQHGICIVVAAIFDFITEEEWGERGRLRVGGGRGGETINSRQQNCIDIVLKWVTSENKTIHTRPHPTPPLKVGSFKYFLRVAQTAV